MGPAALLHPLRMLQGTLGDVPAAGVQGGALAAGPHRGPSGAQGRFRRKKGACPSCRQLVVFCLRC